MTRFTRHPLAILLLFLTGCGGTGVHLPLVRAAAGAPTAVAVVAAGAWPAAQHDVRHTAASPAVGPQTGTVRWTRHLEGSVTPGPVIGADGSVLAASNAGVLHALDPATGRDRWTYNGGAGYGDDLSTSPAVLPDGTVLWPGPRDTVFGLSQNGALLWTVRSSGEPLSPAVVSPTDFYVGDRAGSVAAYRLVGGQPVRRWVLALHDASYGSPAVAPDGSLRVTTSRHLLAIADLGSHAKVAWSFSPKTIIEVSAAVSAEGITVVGTNDGAEYAFTPSGRQLWRRPLRSISYSSPAVVGTSAYFGDSDGALTRVETATGTVISRFTGEAERGDEHRSIWTSPAVDAKGDVYYGTQSGHVYGWGADGRKLFDLVIGGVVDSYPALAGDGALLIGSSSGSLVSIAP